ncbi:MAG: NBR1-Ig-like domain-containing protein [Anaerolineaceae bacterium]|jgi:hypothetical protein|nr:NBR1-Ig-like domain-containing protein [Anaerolineaceae bacterium]
MKHSLSISLLSLTLLALLLASGCVPAPQRLSPEANAPLFLPPTLVPTTAPTSQYTPTPEGGSDQSNCDNNLLFTEDITVPDGTLFEPGAEIDKQWRVENNGTCNWDERYSLRLVAGDTLGADQEQALFPARAGSQAVIRIEFIAPQETGSHRSAWQAFGPDGRPFGDPFYLEIMVAIP